MKNALLATGATVAAVVVGVVGLAGNQPGVMMVLFCSWTPLIVWLSISWYRVLFAGNRRLMLVSLEDQRRRAPANGSASRVLRGQPQDERPL